MIEIKSSFTIDTEVDIAPSILRTENVCPSQFWVPYKKPIDLKITNYYYQVYVQTLPLAIYPNNDASRKIPSPNYKPDNNLLQYIIYHVNVFKVKPQLVGPFLHDTQLKSLGAYTPKKISCITYVFVTDFWFVADFW